MWAFSFKIIDILQGSKIRLQLANILQKFFVYKFEPLIIQGIVSKFHIFARNNS